MPRPSKAQPNALVSSAARVMAGRKKNRPRTSSQWQTEVWEMLDSVGELEFYREWIANALSRCTLEAVEDKGEEDGEVPATDPTVLACMDALFGGQAGQPQMLSSMAGHLSLPGETWIVGLLIPSPDPDIDTWRVLSHEEVKEQGTRWMIDRGDGEPETYDRTEVYVARIWNPHPRRGVEATSSCRSALPILRQMVGLEKRDAANIDSRLIGNGILAVPSEVTFASPGGPTETPEDPLQDPLMAAIIEAGIAAIENPGSAEALFPVLVKAPAEHLDKIKHLTFASDLDKTSMDRQDRLIKRLSNSLNVPAEVLLGMADVNHWTGWLLDDSAIKMHVEPLLELIAHGLTTKYLWPALQGDAEALDPELRRFRIVGSTANLRQRPNRTSEAVQAHSELTITDKAWARETGFKEEDLLDPQSDEFRRRVLVDMVMKSRVPEVVVGALTALGVHLELPAGSTADTSPTAPAALPTAPGPAETTTTETQSPPVRQNQAAALMAVSEVMVGRAVERAWNRVGRRRGARRPVAPAELDTALNAAWESVPRAAALLGVDPGHLRPVLDTYVRGLLSTGTDHDPRALAAALSTVLDPPKALT